MKRCLGAILIGLASGPACERPAPAAERVEVREARARATPPGVEHGAAFLTLSNGGPATQLIAARASVGRAVELHSHVESDGVMKMRRVPAIEVPANGTVELRPGGLHLMLMWLEAPLSVGQTVEITLEFKDGSTQVIRAPVEALPSRHPAGFEHHHGPEPEHDHGDEAPGSVHDHGPGPEHHHGSETEHHHGAGAGHGAH